MFLIINFFLKIFTNFISSDDILGAIPRINFVNSLKSKSPLKSESNFLKKAKRSIFNYLIISFKSNNSLAKKKKKKI